MHYTSTRGKEALSFEDAVMRGLAPDGGLYVPNCIPAAAGDWDSLSFNELAFEIFRLYIPQNEISNAELVQIISKSFASFPVNVVKLVSLTNDPPVSILELFHGPTCAFKDVALQFLGNLFDFFLLRKPGSHLTVVGATSGDTGGAAIYGLKGKSNVEVFILHPENRVSKIQENQMCTVMDANVHNVAVQGTFDDCQAIVKTLFKDEDFRKEMSLGAVNSINWARILAQTTYYFYAYYQISKGQKQKEVRFSVPTGNFGDVLAGFYAKEMGLPIKLVIATNENDILHRFLKTGKYDKSHAVCQTHSPAMDILISSNFERVLYFLLMDQSEFRTISDTASQSAAEKLKSLMDELNSEQSFTVAEHVLNKARSLFQSCRVSDSETIDCMSRYFNLTGYVLDPHTAVGVVAVENLPSQLPTIVCGTASPGKFPEVVLEAVSNKLTFEDFAPTCLHGMDKLPKRVMVTQLGSDGGVKNVKNLISETLGNKVQ